MFHFQYSLFYDLQMLIEVSSFYKKYYLLFTTLDLNGFPNVNCGIGRTGYSRHAFVRAFIVKHLEELKSVPRLIEFLDAHPALTEMCGFSMGSLPDESQFYRFLNDTKNSALEKLHHALNKQLLDEAAITMDHLLIDSKPVMAATRENNFKNPNRNTRNKKKKPKRNPSATLGYYSYQHTAAGNKHFTFFWGYRTHVIVTKEGIALIELTLKNNVTDAKVAKKLIKKLKRVYGLKKGTKIIADAGYDERELYNFIVDELGCKAFIPINPRGRGEEKTFDNLGRPICDAGLPMKSNGRWREGLRDRLKYRCPIKASKKFASDYQKGCPVAHPLFFEGKNYGCTKYLDVTDDARSKVPRDSDLYKRTYRLRTEVERYFSRLGEREAEQTTHYKPRSIKNQMTIAHMSLSLIACAAAVLMKQPEKLRSFRTFAEGFPISLAA